jgi:hypothetical protein
VTFLYRTDPDADPDLLFSSVTFKMQTKNHAHWITEPPLNWISWFLIGKQARLTGFCRDYIVPDWLPGRITVS